MKKEYFLFIIIGVLIVFLSFVITQNIMNNSNKNKTIETSNNNIVKDQSTTRQNQIPDGQVGIVSHKYNGYGQIEVIIKNNTRKELKQVKVIAHCWDKNGNNLGESSNGKYNVNTTETYKIIIYCQTDMNKYKLDLEYE